MRFKKIETKKKSAFVAEQIVEAIRRGVYSVGDKLPAEREISEQMGVSRPSVREALSALQITGILSSKAGDGTYVQHTPAHQEEDLALTLLEESPIEALEARRVLESSIVQLAAIKMTSKSLAEIKSALDRMHRAAQAKDYEAYAEGNQEFHQTIAEATGNVFIVKSILPLLEVMKRQLARSLREKYYLADSDFFGRSFELHHKIFSALESKDERAAVLAMDRHFLVIEASVKGEVSSATE
ncbi:FadR family transcriptional regulator [Candidatus Acetothermia bacterium]|nr:FadR family transcriptional regulator [Candidatus Acetothermia bacterium]